MKSEVDEHPGVRRSRCRLSARAYIETDGARMPVQLLDLSMSGARLLLPSDALVSTPPRLVLELHGRTGEPLRISGTVVRASAESLAVNFDAKVPPLSDALEALLEREGRVLTAID